MKERVYSSIRNSIAFNIIEDDPTIKNYVALARCLDGIEIKDDRLSEEYKSFKDIEVVEEEGKMIVYPGVSVSCRMYELYEHKELKNKRNTKGNSYAKVLYEVSNIKTKEVKLCTSVREISELTGIKQGHIHTYSNTGHVYNNQWKFKKLHKGKARKSRQLRAINNDTGECLEFKSIRQAAIFFKKSDATIHGYLNKKNHKVYKFEYSE